MGGAACTGLAFCCMHYPAKMKNMCTCTKNKKKTHHTFSWIFECRHPLKQHCSTKSISQTTLEPVLASSCTESGIIQLREKSCWNLKKDTEDSHISNTRLIRAVFKWLSKVITWLWLLRLVIVLKDSPQFFNQWDEKPKPIAPCTHDFSHASSEFQVLLEIVIGSSRCLHLSWLVGVIALVLVFRQSFENCSKQQSGIQDWVKAQ